MILIKLCQFLKISYKIESSLAGAFSEAEAIIHTVYQKQNECQWAENNAKIKLQNKNENIWKR